MGEMMGTEDSLLWWKERFVEKIREDSGGLLMVWRTGAAASRLQCRPKAF